MNLAQEYLGPTADPNRWVDLSLVMEGSDVRDVQEIFLQDWAYATRSTKENPGTEHVAGGDARAQVVASGPDVLGDPLYDVLLSAIHNSKRRVWIVTPYFIPDESLAKALELAVKRGVEVKVLIPERSNHRLADLARGSFVRQLQNAGARILLFPRMIHAKGLLVDDQLAVLGSANFDMRSLLLNYELGLVIYSGAALTALENWIAGKQAEAKERIVRAGYFRDLAEGVGRILGPIL